MKVLLSSNPYRDKGLRTALEAGEILKRSGVEISFCLPFHMKKGDKLGIPPHLPLSDMEKELAQSHILLCFGGDGTILHAARDAVRYDLPVLGVNMGSVGFMAELELSELHMLKKLAKEDFFTESRMMLQVRVVQGERVLLEELALNDAVVTKGSMARVAEMEVVADGITVSTICGDGVIFSTPTGSTAYSLSAGGAVMEPSAQCISMTPVCAHQLGARAMIFAPERRLVVGLPRGSKKHLYLAVDGGKPFRICGGTRVEITRAEEETQLIRLTNRSFYEILQHKLGGR